MDEHGEYLESQYSFACEGNDGGGYGHNDCLFVYLGDEFGGFDVCEEEYYVEVERARM